MIRLFKRLTLQEIGLILMSFLFVFAQVWLEIEIPSYMSEITVLLQQEGTTLVDILKPGGMMIFLSLLSLVAAIIVGFIGARLAASFTTSLRHDVYTRVMEFSQTEMKEFSIPSLLTRTTNDITQVQNLITMGLQVVIKGPVMAIWAMTKISGKSVDWLLAIAVAVISLVIVMSTLMTLVFPKQRIIQSLTDKLNSITRESLTGVRVVRAYNAEDYQTNKFETLNTEVTQTNLFINRLLSIMSPFMTIMTSGLTLAIYWIGAHLVNQAALSDKLTVYSDMIVFTSYAMQVVFGFMLMLFIFMVLPRTVVSARRINEVLDTYPSIIYPNEKAVLSDKHGEVSFENVSFSYSPTAKPVIENVTFTAQKGQTVAFIGSTGSGKSTLIDLIPRFYDVTSGQIKINGIPIHEYDKETLHSIVGYIPQKAVLFRGDIAQNIDFGTSLQSPLSDEAMWEALELAQSKEFVLQKENQLHADVAQGGTNFSGGQRQRLAISRALGRKPEIIIFDDSFSALDYKTDKALRAALNEKTKEMTKLIVAQRISTIMDADLILVLDKGQVVGMGTHQELLQTNAIYQEIAYSQLSKEELENGK